MALFDFDVDLLPVWAGAIGAGATTLNGEEPYATLLAAEPTRYDDDSEQRIVIMMDIMRSYLETVTDRAEIQRFHQAMSRVLGEVAYSRVYDDLSIYVSGNVPVGVTAGGLTLGLTATDRAGTAVVTAPAAVGGATLAALITNINALGAPFDVADGAGVYVEAYDNGGRLGLRTTRALAGANLTAAHEQTIEFTGDLLPAVGIPSGVLYTNGVNAAARRARDKGLDHFHREIRAAAMP